MYCIKNWYITDFSLRPLFLWLPMICVDVSWELSMLSLGSWAVSWLKRGEGESAPVLVSLLLVGPGTVHSYVSAHYSPLETSLLASSDQQSQVTVISRRCASMPSLLSNH